ncbi:acyl-CoA N-acyltransferase [Venturia nashicola]|uniref:Acyl-CoA N-acyltransferase n=1 Tax=Venturia nashicola TaxID=86259 RepID=A0A4Z1NYW6_9PEZI|nr:acyl-CoA N-acyltransferase [Venturia nashicola]
MQAEELEIDVTEVEMDPNDDVLGGSAPLELMQAAPGRAASVSRGSTMQRETRLHRLMPYTLTLSVEDVAQCEIVENEAFPPHERASRDKFIYRLRKCSGLCYGVFTTVDPHLESDRDDLSAPTYAVAPPVETSSERRRVLLGHIVATLSTNDLIKDEDMDLPSDWQSSTPASSNLGHKPHGRTLMVHSLAVLPEYQGKGVGTLLMGGFIKRMREASIADRIALLAEDGLVPFYNSLGFDHLGESAATFGGVRWKDMVYDFTAISPASGSD